jgi:hypothetical protein
MLTHDETLNLAGEDVSLTLWNLGQPEGVAVNRWTAGSIAGSATSHINVIGSRLWLNGEPGGLSTTLIVEESAGQNFGSVDLFDMTANLTLSGEANYIDIRNGGSLVLSQHVGEGQQPDTVGGIELAGGHTGSLAILVGSGGKLSRLGVVQDDANNRIKVAGTIHNAGGIVELMGGGMLNLTGQDGNGYSYWQHNSAEAMLTIDQYSYSRIIASGSYRIDTGTVRLTAPSQGSKVALAGTGLIFGDINDTFFTIVDSAPGLAGNLTVLGSVTLGQLTTSTMNFNGGDNTADFLDVHDGTLTLNGTLRLLSSDGMKPSENLTFFSSSGEVSASILGGFETIMDNVGGTHTSYVEMIDPYLYYFKVLIE